MEHISKDIAWCPGCGNFSLLKIMKQVISDMGLAPEKTVMVSGIGQAAKMPQYLNLNMFNGLHGRALPPATAIKTVNPELTVLVESGDGDMYGEGGNHLMHTIRRNPDITVIVHDNMIYGLTKGQASPTSRKGLKTSLQVHGVVNEPFNSLSFAVAMGASFVAQVSSGNQKHAAEIIKQAINHKGFSLVNAFQPCVTFNKTNTYAWFKQHTYQLDEGYNPTDRMAAMEKAFERENMPLGVIYKNTEKQPYEEAIYQYADIQKPIANRTPDTKKVKEMLDSYR